MKTDVTKRALSLAFGINEVTLTKRLIAGWDLREALTTPTKQTTRYKKTDVTKYADGIINNIHGEKITNGGARAAIEKGLTQYGYSKYNDALKEMAKAVKELNDKKTIEMLKLMMELM